VLFDIGGQIAGCAWDDQRHRCGIELVELPPELNADTL
jgi:hypothetical protein